MNALCMMERMDVTSTSKGCSNKVTNRMLLLEPRCTRLIISSWHPLLLVISTRLSITRKCFFGHFLLRLSGIKRFQVMFKGTFGPTVDWS